MSSGLFLLPAYWTNTVITFLALGITKRPILVLVGGAVRTSTMSTAKRRTATRDVVTAPDGRRPTSRPVVESIEITSHCSTLRRDLRDALQDKALHGGNEGEWLLVHRVVAGIGQNLQAGTGQ